MPVQGVIAWFLALGNARHITIGSWDKGRTSTVAVDRWSANQWRINMYIITPFHLSFVLENLDFLPLTVTWLPPTSLRKWGPHSCRLSSPSQAQSSFSSPPPFTALPLQHPTAPTSTAITPTTSYPLQHPTAPTATAITPTTSYPFRTPSRATLYRSIPRTSGLLIRSSRAMCMPTTLFWGFKRDWRNCPRRLSKGEWKETGAWSLGQPNCPGSTWFPCGPIFLPEGNIVRKYPFLPGPGG